LVSLNIGLYFWFKKFRFKLAQVSKIGFIFSAKVSASLVQAFLSGLFFSGKVNFSQSQLPAKVLAVVELAALAFFQFNLVFVGDCRACRDTKSGL